MFCDDGHSKLVPESTQPGFSLSWTIMDSLHKKVKGEDLLLEKNVIDIFACITQGRSEEV